MKHNLRKTAALALSAGMLLQAWSFSIHAGEQSDAASPAQDPQDTALSSSASGLADPDTYDLIASQTESEEPSARKVIKRTVRIYTADDLRELSENCVLDAWSEGLTVQLENDIDLTGARFHSIPCFSGVFEGNGHTISGFNVQGDVSHTGLFRYLNEKAIVRNLHVSGRLSCRNGGLYVGGIAGNNDGLISGCSFHGEISAQQDAGGIAGVNGEKGVIAGCLFTGSLLSAHAAGGIAGLNQGKILRCVNDGKINTEVIEVSDSLTSELPAELPEAISNFDVSQLSNENIIDIINTGGIAGQSEGFIDNCINRGPVGYARTGYNVGGIAGITSGYIRSCTNEGDICGRKDTGGIAGQIEPETVWDYSSEQLDELLSQLKELDALLANLASDAAAGVGNTRDDIAVAEGYASNAVSELESLLDDVSSEFFTQAANIRSLMDLLKKSIREDDAEGIKSSLSRLHDILQETDFFSQPAAIGLSSTLSGNAGANLSVTSSRFRSLLLSFAAWIQSAIQNGAPQGGAQIPEDLYDDLFSGSDGGATAPDDVDELPEDSYIYDDTAGGEDAPYEDVIAPEYGYEEDFSDDYSEDVSDEPDAYFIEEDSSFTYAADELPDGEAEAQDPGEDPSGDSGNEPDAGNDSGNEPDEGSDSGNEPDADNTISGQGWADISGESNGSFDLNLNGSILTSLDGSVQLDLSELFPDAGELTSVLQELMAHSASLVDTETLALAKDVLDDIHFTQPDTEPFFSSVRDLMTALRPLDDDIASISSTAASDIRAVTEQMDTILETFFSDMENISLLEKKEESDVSLPDPWQSDDGAIFACVNRGTVSADTNVGGIAGAVSYEDLFDAEDLVDLTGYILKDAKKLIFASVRDCENIGAVSAKKTAAGGIVGMLEYGIATGCLSSGEISVTDGEYCGGVAGSADGSVTECLTKNLINGNSYSGGIAGKGAAIMNCISYSQVNGKGAYVGAVAGWSDGNVSDNLYYDRGLGGVDGVSFTGRTDPVTMNIPTVQTGYGADPRVLSSVLAQNGADTKKAGTGAGTDAALQDTQADDAADAAGSPDAAGSSDTSGSSDASDEQGTDTPPEAADDQASGSADAQPVPDDQATDSADALSAPDAEAADIEEPAPDAQTVSSAEEVIDAAFSAWRAETESELSASSAQTQIKPPAASDTQDTDSAEAKPGSAPFADETESDDQTLSAAAEPDMIYTDDPVLTFMVNGRVAARIVVPFGEGITQLPKVENDGDDYWVWDTFDQDAIYSDMTIEGSYKHPVRTLSASGNPPLFLAEGVFYEGQKLQVESTKVPSPVKDMPDVDCYTVTVNGYSDPLKVRMKAESGGTLYQAKDGKALSELSYTTDGSYLVFELENGGSFLYAMPKEAQIGHFRVPVRVLVPVLIAAAIVLIFILVRIRRRRKKKAS